MNSPSEFKWGRANCLIGSVMCAPKWQLNPFKLSKELVFKRIGKNGLKRTHYLVVKKELRNKKYIHDFISNFEEDYLEG